MYFGNNLNTEATITEKKEHAHNTTNVPFSEAKLSFLNKGLKYSNTPIRAPTEKVIIEN